MSLAPSAVARLAGKRALHSRSHFLLVASCSAFAWYSAGVLRLLWRAPNVPPKSLNSIDRLLSSLLPPSHPFVKACHRHSLKLFARSLAIRTAIPRPSHSFVRGRRRRRRRRTERGCQSQKPSAETSAAVTVETPEGPALRSGVSLLLKPRAAAPIPWHHHSQSAAVQPRPTLLLAGKQGGLETQPSTRPPPFLPDVISTVDLEGKQLESGSGTPASHCS